MGWFSSELDDLIEKSKQYAKGSPPEITILAKCVELASSSPECKKVLKYLAPGHNLERKCLMKMANFEKEGK